MSHRGGRGRHVGARGRVGEVRGVAVAVAAANGGDVVFGGAAGRELEERERAPE